MGVPVQCSRGQFLGKLQFVILGCLLLLHFAKPTPKEHIKELSMKGLIIPKLVTVILQLEAPIQDPKDLGRNPGGPCTQ